MQQIPLSSPDISEEEVQAVVEVMRSGRLSIGRHIEQFEQLCADRAGRRFGIGVNSGTSGLHLCVKAVGLGAGDEVITSPFSFVATTNCLLFEGARPVFADIDPVSYNLDPGAIASVTTDRTRGLLPVEVFGNVAHFDRYEQLAAENGWCLIEDCCEAMGAQLDCGGQSRPAGSFGKEAGVFAFYPNKQITTGEGGMIVTDREDFRDLFVSLRNQGRATEEWLSHARLGYNYRLSEVNAVIGEVQMRRLDEILAKRRAAAKLYDDALAPLVSAGELHLPPQVDRATASWFVYVVRLGDRYAKADRDSVIADLRAEGVGCNCYFVPIHTQPYIMETLGTKEGDFPVTEHVAARTIALPFFGNLSESQVSRVVEVLTRSLADRAR